MARTQTRPAAGPADLRPKAGRNQSRPALPRARYPRNAPAPVLAEVRRGSVVESRHRGHIVQVDDAGRVVRGAGDPDHMVWLRSAGKPFTLLALLEADGADQLHLTNSEISVMAGSHNGEDIHIRTIQGMLRRAGLSQSLLACGTEGAPADPLTAARLAREGEAPGAIRHMCSGFHAASLLLSRLNGWTLSDYWQADHPSQRASAAQVARVFRVRSSELVTATDACGAPTFAFPLTSVARAFAHLANPDSAVDGLAPALRRIRDAMLAAPEMIEGSRDALDTTLMRAKPGALVAKTGAEGLLGIGLLGESRAGAGGGAASGAGMAVKIEDGDGKDRAKRSVAVEALAQLRALTTETVERLQELHRPPAKDPRGVEIASTVPVFQLAPLSELA